MVIKIHIYLFLAIAYMYAIQNLDTFLFSYIFVIMHELAHIAVAALVKINICEIELLPVGINAKYSFELPKEKELVISLAGPFASFLFYIFLKNPKFKFMNLMIALMNLIPLKPYDGGRIVTSFVSIILNEKVAEKINSILQKVCMIFLIFVAIISVIFLKNYYLAIVCIYMICIMKEEGNKVFTN